MYFFINTTIFPLLLHYYIVYLYIFGYFSYKLLKNKRNCPQITFEGSSTVLKTYLYTGISKTIEYGCILYTSYIVETCL